MKRMTYSLYRQFYIQFPAEGYDPKTKTIMVDVPNIRRKPFPKEWKRIGNHYSTPGGCEVVFWNTGFAENFLARRYFSCYYEERRTIYPGIDALERVMECVALFESINMHE